MMRSLNVSHTALDCASNGLSSRLRRPQDRPRVACIPRVAQGRSDAATSVPLIHSSTDPAVSSLIAAEPSSSHVPVGATAAAAAGAQPYNGQAPPGVSEVGPLPPFNAQGFNPDASTSINGAGDMNGRVSSSANMRWAGSYSSSSSGSDRTDAWEPPSYRRAGIRLRSKRALQAAEHWQRTGQNLVLEELHQVLHTSTSSSGSDSNDDHLESFIEQMLCTKQNLWERSRPSTAAACADGREALDPELLANIGSLPAEEVFKVQMQLAQNGQLLAALLLLEEAAAAGRADVLESTSHKAFLQAAGKAGNSAAVLRFLQLLPAEYAHPSTYNLALKACANARDLRAALRVVDMMTTRQVPTNFIHFTTLISVCAASGDIAQAFAVFQKAKAAEEQLAAAAAAAAAAAGAGSSQQKEARRAQKMDGQVYGALIAACAQAIRARSSDMREQLVLLERAFQVLQGAMDSGVHLETPVWNALLMCAGRCRQLQRCFEVLDLMTAVGVPSDPITYTCLIEAAVLAGEVEMAQRVFARAIAAGVTGSVQLYTAAINACMADDRTNFEAAFEIYATMQRYGVEPDDLLYGHLIAIAGRCRKLEVAFDLLEDMRASGLKPSTPTCSALIYACLQNNNFAAARKVYDTLVARGVPPHISQYNTLMEQYALRCQLGNVVSLVTNMIAGGVQPNANTFRILLLACQRTDQAELAFELYQTMKARGLQPRLNNAHSICYTLLKACFNRIRKSWRPGGYPPEARVSSIGPLQQLTRAQASRSQAVAQCVAAAAIPRAQQWPAAAGGWGAPAAAAAAAGGSSSGSGRQQHLQGRRYTLLDNAENINWPLLALSTYRDFVGWGYKPHLEVLDRLLACLRLQPPKALRRPVVDEQRAAQLQAQLQPLVPGAATSDLSGQPDEPQASSGLDQAGPDSLSSGSGQQQGQQLNAAAFLRDLARERRVLHAEERPYEVPFDRRALEAVQDAISMGLLPALKLDAPLTVDMRSFPPCVAEAYVHVMMIALESRAGAAAGEGKRQPVVTQPVRLIVPPFDHNYVMWPSYVEKLYVHYNEQLLARQAQLRAEVTAARARASSLAARAFAASDDEDEDISTDQLLLTFGGNPAAAASSSIAASAAAAVAGVAQPLPSAADNGTAAAAASAAVAAARTRRAAAPGALIKSLDSGDFDDELNSSDFSGFTAALSAGQPGAATAAHGRYIAGAVTGLAVAATFRRLKAYARMDSASGAMKLDPQEVYRWLSAKVRSDEERRRIAREAELASSGYNSTTAAYYQQHVYVQPPQQPWVRTGGGSSSSDFNRQQQQQQQPGSPQAAQQQQQHPQQQQWASGSGGASPTGSSMSSSAGQFSVPDQHQQQQQPSFSPGFGVAGQRQGMSALGQQARDIRLGLGAAAASGLKRPERSPVRMGQQPGSQPGSQFGQLPPLQQQQQQPPPQQQLHHTSGAAGGSAAQRATSSSSSGRERRRRQGGVGNSSSTAAAAEASSVVPDQQQLPEPMDASGEESNSAQQQ